MAPKAARDQWFPIWKGSHPPTPHERFKKSDHNWGELIDKIRATYGTNNFIVYANDKYHYELHVDPNVLFQLGGRKTFHDEMALATEGLASIGFSGMAGTRKTIKRKSLKPYPEVLPNEGFDWQSGGVPMNRMNRRPPQSDKPVGIHHSSHRGAPRSSIHTKKKSSEGCCVIM